MVSLYNTANALLASQSDVTPASVFPVLLTFDEADVSEILFAFTGGGDYFNDGRAVVGVGEVVQPADGGLAPKVVSRVSRKKERGAWQ
jgi:hypothetical protein